MTMRLTNANWETLSAYLDGQLSPRERANIEQELRSNDELRAGLDELRRTRALLRSRPRIRAPRNFTLTPEMVGLDRRRTASRGWFQGFSLASVLATLALLVVFAGDLLGIGTRQVNMAMEAAPEAAQIEIITQAVEAPIEESAEMMAESGSTMLLETEAPLLAAKAAVESTPIPEEPLSLKAPYPPSGAGDASVLPPEATPALAYEAAPTPTPGLDLALAPPSAEDMARSAEGQLEEAPTESEVLSGQIEAKEQPALENVPEDTRELSSNQLIELGLGALAIITALVAFIFWRRSRA